MDPENATPVSMTANTSAPTELVSFILNTTLRESFASATGNRSLEGGALALLFLGFFASSLNTWLMVVICTHSCLKKSVMNYFVRNLALPCLLESIFAIPVSWNHYSTQSPWKWKESVCRFDAVVLMLVSLVITCFLFVMCIEQYMSTKRPSHTKNQFGECKQRIATTCVWTACFSITLPVIVGSQDVRAFPSRLGCAVAEVNCGAFLVELLLVFAFPTVSALFILLVTFIKLRRQKDSLDKKRKELTFTEYFFEESYRRNNLADSKFCGVLMLLYVVLHFPYIANQIYLLSLICFSPADISSGNATLSDPFLVTPITCTFETYLTWIRYSFSLAFPLTTFIFRKDIRRRNVLLFGCCISNSAKKPPEVETIEASEPGQQPIATEKTSNCSKKRTNKNKRKKSESVAASQDVLKYIMSITPDILFPFRNQFFGKDNYFLSRYLGQTSYKRYTDHDVQVTSFGEGNLRHPQTCDIIDDEEDDDELDSKEYATVVKTAHLVRQSSVELRSGPSTIKLSAWGSDEDSCEDSELNYEGRFRSEKMPKTNNKKLVDRRSSLPVFLNGNSRIFKNSVKHSNCETVPLSAGDLNSATGSCAQNAIKQLTQSPSSTGLIPKSPTDSKHEEEVCDEARIRENSQLSKP